MTYSQDIDALGPDHRWPLSANSTDAVGSVNGSDTSMLYTGVALCEGATNSAVTNGFTDRVTLATSTDINNASQDRKVMCGWYMTDSIQAHPCRIYGEGTNTLCFQIMMAMGNNLMFECVDSGFTLQVYGPPLAVNRKYHITAVFLGSGYANEIQLFVDGVEQLNASPSNRQPGATTIAARGVGIFGDPSGTVGVGGDVVLLQAARDGHYNEWTSFNAANAVLTDTEIREELFEKGALPTITISSGTESAMQTALDAYADTVRADAPLCIRISDVTGSGDLALDADNITFDALASIHVQWMGTGTLSWTNNNGADASIGSTPNGGTLTFVNPATLTINGLINGSEIRIYDDETPGGGDHDTELDGVETLSGTSFEYSHGGTTNDIIVQIISSGYEEIKITHTLTSFNQTLTVFPVVEENL